MHDAADRAFRAMMLRFFAVVGALALLLVACALSHAKDNGQFANSPLKPWFDKLASGKGLCCSFTDGVTVEGVDWDTGGQYASAGEPPHMAYRVRLCKALPPGASRNDWKTCKDKVWFVVPDTALVTEPNKYGDAVVWPYQDWEGKTQIRCFIPGSGA